MLYYKINDHSVLLSSTAWITSSDMFFRSSTVRRETDRPTLIYMIIMRELVPLDLEEEPENEWQDLGCSVPHKRKSKVITAYTPINAI